MGKVNKQQAYPQTSGLKLLARKVLFSEYDKLSVSEIKAISLNVLALLQLFGIIPVIQHHFVVIQMKNNA